ncbi:GNAT family N-acetyltransferase [Naumannella sp. ID2617S]|nr:GNAT family N-acetyltransferase [Naumannella sp. ID2617S]
MQELTDHADLLAATGDDPWVRWAVPAEGLHAWVERGVIMVRRDGERRGLWVTPRSTATAADVRAALTAARTRGLLERLAARTVSIDQRWAETVHAVLTLGRGGDWEWQWTRTEPAAYADPPGLRGVRLDDRLDAEELNAFARSHNDRVWSNAGDGHMVHWIGLRDAAGELVAIGGSEREATGVPHLGGIVTHRALRGRGLGRLISARLTRWALADSGVSTLGMYSDNSPARVVYQRLGYRTAHAWHSRWLTEP